MATLQQLEAALVNADKAGDADAARRLAAAVKAARSDSASQIPGAQADMGQAVTPPPSRGVVESLGAVEAIPAVATAMTTGPVGGAVNWLNQLVIEGLQGNLSDPEASKRISGAFDAGLKAMTYAPRTQAGQEATAAVADAGQALAPLAGLGGEMAMLANASRAARAAPVGTVARASAEGVARDVAGPAAAAGVSTAIDATATAAQAVKKGATTLPRRALAAISREEPKTPTPGTMGSAGAAATDMATQRVTTAESLGLTGDAALTKGQATRDAAQLKFETETAKIPDMGADLRARRIAQNDVLLRNFDNAIDQTGAEAPTLRAVGQAVDDALVKQYTADKAQVNLAYKRAKASPEASALVDQAVPVTIGEGDRAVTGTPLSFLNEQPTGLPNTGLADSARQFAVKLGIAEMQDGALVPRPATIRQLEEWRSAIGQSTGYEPSDIRVSTILKGLIDAQTEPVAGPLFRQARATRARLAQNYEDRASIAKLLNEKRGTSDRAVALEDVFKHSVLDGSLDDVRNMRRVLQRGGAEGQQAWKELQGQTLKHIRDAATKSVAADSSGNRVISPAALDTTIRGLDVDGKLGFIFGKQGAQRLRDINEIAQVAKTVPPEAAVNFSNTASTLLTGFADLGLSTMTGVPAPLATATRLGLKHIKDKKLRARIDDALRGANNNQ